MEEYFQFSHFPFFTSNLVWHVDIDDGGRSEKPKWFVFEISIKDGI